MRCAERLVPPRFPAAAQRAAHLIKRNPASFPAAPQDQGDIGAGKFSCVKMVREKDSGLVRAAKLIQKGSYGDEIQLMMRELHVLSRLEHENILVFYAAFASPASLILITEIGAIFATLPSTAARRRSHTPPHVHRHPAPAPLRHPLVNARGSRRYAHPRLLAYSRHGGELCATGSGI